MVTKNAIGSNIPIELAKGGTNATSFSTSTGILKYDGTSLVTSSTALIDSSNRFTNTSQPAFFAYPGAAQDNCTGDGTVATIVLGSELFDQGSNFASNTFTAPVNGIYHFDASIGMNGLTTSHTECSAYMVVNGNQQMLLSGNFGAMKASNAPELTAVGSCNRYLTAGQTATLNLYITGGTKVVDIDTTAYRTFFSGYLVC